jgi:ubiquinone/menaquinone biosynthesis C-methylase UbiE
MLRELAHFLFWAPQSLYLKGRLTQAELYDRLMGRAESHGMAPFRRRLVEGLRGEVLEVGAGTGLGLPYYGADTRVVALEPDADFRALAAPRAAASAAQIEFDAGSLDALPFADGRFDAVVCALVLCSVGDVGTALCEMRRVLRPGGEVRLIEHVRSEGKLAGRLMDLANPVWLALNGQGCNLHRDTTRLLREADYELLEDTPFQLFSPGFPAFPMRLLRTRPRGPEERAR